MGKEVTKFGSFIIPFESFVRGTKGGAIVFRVPDGDLKGFSFVRPATMVMKSNEKGKPGFKASYFIKQVIEGDDVVSEEHEDIELKKSEKGSDGKWQEVEKFVVSGDEMEEAIS